MASVRLAALSLATLNIFPFIAPSFGAEESDLCSEEDLTENACFLQKQVQRSAEALQVPPSSSSNEAPAAAAQVGQGAVSTPDGKPWDKPLLLQGPESCNRTRLPFTEAFVINMDMATDKWKGYLDHMHGLCGFDGISVSRHSGVLVTPELRASEWVRHYIPGVNPDSRIQTGSLGSALAHLSLWDRIAHSDACMATDAGDKYALVMEDDEKLNENFEAHASSLMQQLAALPSEKKPDVVLLNPLRPWGKQVSTVGPEELPLLEVIKSPRDNRHDYRTKGGLHYNIWLSVYLVRCSGASKLVEYGGNYPNDPNARGYNGLVPTFDIHVNDFLTDSNVPLITYVIGKTMGISTHPEGDNFRSKMDKLGLEVGERYLANRSAAATSPSAATLVQKQTATTKKGDRRTHVCSEEGRALPILITGVQKTGSSTTYDDLIETLWLRQDIPCDVSNTNTSERGFWKCKEPHLLCWNFDPTAYPRAWGSCQESHEGLIADFTPENFYYPYIPARIRQVYGDEKSKEIVFLLGFREPLRRMLSAFGNGVSVGWLYHHSRPNITFEEHVSEFLAQWDSHEGEKWIPELWKHNDFRTVDQSLYYQKIQNYLDAGFQPSQFVVYPGEAYLSKREDLNSNPVLEALRERLGDDVLRPAKKNHTPTVDNRGEYTPLEESLKNTTLRSRLEQEVFGPANQRLMELLAKMMGQGMTLVGYTGEANDVAAVGKWMESQWMF